MTLDLAATLGDLARFFDQERIPWAVIGGLALASYGAARSTYDIDLVLPRREQDPVIDHLVSIGFRTLHRSMGYSNHQHETKGRVDVVWVDERTARKLFAAVETHSALGIEVPLPAAEHLVAMKVAAYANDPERRLQDLADIRSLIRLRGLDPEAVRMIFARYDRPEDVDLVIR